MPSRLRTARSAFDWAGGLLIVATGLYVGALALGYGVGSISRPGAGFFPLAAGVLMVLLGAGTALFVREVEPVEGGMRWRAAVSVFGAVLAWALLLKPLGFAPATVALVVIAAAAHPQPNPKRVLATMILLPLIGWLIFLEGLGIQVPAFAFPGGWR